MRILFLGDIVGEPGRKSVIKFLPQIKEEHRIDFTILNGENSASGRGITPAIANDLFKAGAQVITTGDHVWDQRELADHLENEPRILRPLNYPENVPGSGEIIIDTESGKIAVLNAQGRTFMGQALENPFLMLEERVVQLKADGVQMIFLDFHAETTSEKIAMGFHLDGKASVVVGTHTHVQTADERILPEGTAHITDAGMCGPEISVLGRNVDSIVYRFKSSLPTRFPVAKGPVRLCGIIAEIDPMTGKAKNIERYNRLLEPSEM
ncbi:TIGR00282 family metallophosphoesterase [Rubritalea marina]|uniref:TIGR00282 family metallophosphoesterase n=1 Tax=Rubritalea marina TaxID=361055 RepID=UPI00037B0B30|nr:TIGR00282 family metallophosphoesterase [Rubritalea marina]